MNSLTVIQQQCKSSEKCPEWKASRVCSPWGFSSLVRSFLSLVLWDAGSQFSCFSQWCTDPQVSLQNHKPVCTGVIFLAAQDLTAQAHAYARTHILTHSRLRCCCWLWWWEESLVVLALPLLCVPSVTFFSGLSFYSSKRFDVKFLSVCATVLFDPSSRIVIISRLVHLGVIWMTLSCIWE